jgi:transcriptional regulator with XRE-family HTH domain
VGHAQLADNIRRARNLLGYTQEAAADACGLSTRAYQRHEAATADLRVSTLIKLAEGLETTTEALMHRVNRRTAVRGASDRGAP